MKNHQKLQIIKKICLRKKSFIYSSALIQIEQSERERKSKTFIFIFSRELLCAYPSLLILFSKKNRQKHTEKKVFFFSSMNTN